MGPFRNLVLKGMTFSDFKRIPGNNHALEELPDDEQEKVREFLSLKAHHGYDVYGRGSKDNPFKHYIVNRPPRTRRPRTGGRGSERPRSTQSSGIGPQLCVFLVFSLFGIVFLVYAFIPLLIIGLVLLVRALFSKCGNRSMPQSAAPSRRLHRPRYINLTGPKDLSQFSRPPGHR